MRNLFIERREQGRKIKGQLILLDRQSKRKLGNIGLTTKNGQTYQVVDQNPANLLLLSHIGKLVTILGVVDRCKMKIYLNSLHPNNSNSAYLEYWDDYSFDQREFCKSVYLGQGESAIPLGA